MLLQVFDSVRQFVEQISYNLLFRWFVGLSMEVQCVTTWCSARAATGSSNSTP